jgi:hypothetical protein
MLPGPAQEVRTGPGYRLSPKHSRRPTFPAAGNDWILMGLLTVIPSGDEPIYADQILLPLPPGMRAVAA